ncbi:MAG: nascent polypeptide-associated complex protein [Candidatus Altiarchaeota archaeon]
MFPRGINPRQMQQMMKKLGIKTEEINAESVVIHSSEKDIIIENPQVVKTVMQGQEIFQISGNVKEQTKNSEKVSISEEDIKIVMEQAKVSKEKAKEALEKTNGDIAEAIINLKS